MGQVAGHGVEHAERAKDVAVRVHQRGAGVEADRWLADDERVLTEALVAGGVRYNQELVGAHKRVRAEGHLARQFAISEAYMHLEPLAVGVDEAYEGDRGAADLCGEPGKIIKVGLWGAV